MFPSPTCPADCQAATLLEQQQMYLAGPDFQSVLDVNSLLKLNAVGDHIKDDRDGKSQGYEALHF